MMDIQCAVYTFAHKDPIRPEQRKHHKDRFNFLSEHLVLKIISSKSCKKISELNMLLEELENRSGYKYFDHERYITEQKYLTGKRYTSNFL